VKRAAAAALLFLIVASACGKVGPPQAPIKRTPQAINDLRVSQSGHSVTLSWTNPALYIDNNGVTDLAAVLILRNGMQISKETAAAAGQPQSFTVDVSNSLGTDLSFAVQVETQRGRVSTLSSSVPIRPVEVPGPPVRLRAVTDQKRIILDWDAPERNPSLAQVYFLQRSDRATPVPPQTTNHFEDAEFEPDKKYDYTITAVREGGIPGLSGASIQVTATDKTSPTTPTGLEIKPLGPGMALVNWNSNPERDLKEYRVYRSDQADEPILVTVDAFTDTNYRPGISYQVEAVDESGNRSGRSAPQTGP